MENVQWLDSDRLRTSDTQAIHIQQRVTHAQELIRSMIQILVLVVWKQLWQVVLGALLADAVRRGDENIG